MYNTITRKFENKPEQEQEQEQDRQLTYLVSQILALTPKLEKEFLETLSKINQEQKLELLGKLLLLTPERKQKLKNDFREEFKKHFEQQESNNQLKS